MKKGLTKTVRTLIIILLIFIVLLVFYVRLESSIKGKSDREVCRSTLTLQAATERIKAVQEPECKTYKVVFFNDHVEINGKNTPVYDPRKQDVVSYFDGLTDDIVNRVVAEELRWCWYQFAEGTLKNAFNMLAWRNVIENFIGGRDHRLCALCDEVEFDESVEKKQFTGFYKYIKEKPMINSNKTYYEFLAHNPNTVCEHYEDSAMNCWDAYEGYELIDKKKIVPEALVLNKTSKYIVTFIKRGKYAKNPAGTLLGTEVSYFAYVFNQDDRKYLCDSIWRGPMK